MKNEQQIEIFTGVRVDCIRQDFFGTLFMYNYERLLEKMDEDHIQQINEEHKKKGEDPVSIDHNECWYSTKENFKFWFNAKDIGSSNRAILDFLPAYEKYRYSVREGRKFPRIFRVIKLFGKYKTLNNYRAVV